MEENLSLLELKYLKAKIAYYEGNSILTDAEFDVLEKILKEKGSKVIEQVGSKRKDFDFTHPTKMLSLAKIQTEATPEGTNYVENLFQQWYQKRRSKIGVGVELLASPKFDGNAINIIYKGYNLINVLTRGDGFTGKDITKRFLNAIDNPIKVIGLDLKETDILEIRCEVVIETQIFNDKYALEFANPRNYVAGVIGKDDEDEVKISELSIIPLHFILNGEHVEQSHFKMVRNCGMNYNTKFLSENYVQTIKSFENLRENFRFQLDGVVISYPPLYRKGLGENDHDPEWALAIKFVPKETITEVEGIEWNISKRGELIPTVLLKPVLLDGSTVRRCSGYNANYLKENKVSEGAVISISKAGDIIPEIQKVIVGSPFSPENYFPAVCPYCNSSLSFNGVHLLCPNEKCVGRIAKQLSGAAKIIELQGVGEKTLEPFAKTFDSMYHLIVWVYAMGKSTQIEKYGIKWNSRSHELFVQAFLNIKSLTYTQVIQMLGYDNVGEKLSTQLAREHAGLDFDYANLERALVSKLRSPEISDYIKKVVGVLENLGIKIDKPQKPISNTTTIYVCMTGSPKNFGWKTKEEFLAQFPHVEEVSVTDKKCRFLITDSYESKSSKMEQARKKGVEIVTYKDVLIDLI
jgi:NAD-dependent DNA ligase